MPLEANVKDSASQDEDAMYERLMQETAQPATRSKGSKSTSETTSAPTTSAPPRKVKPDVVIEVEGTQEARERGHVVIAIENADPDLQVQIVVRAKGHGCCWFELLLVWFLLSWNTSDMGQWRLGIN